MCDHVSFSKKNVLFQGFFKKQRHVPEILRKCLRNKDCVIDLVSRNSCQYCRYHKILQLVDGKEKFNKYEIILVALNLDSKTKQRKWH